MVTLGFSWSTISTARCCDPVASDQGRVPPLRYGARTTSGTSFAVIYATLGCPSLCRRSLNRRNIIADRWLSQLNDRSVQFANSFSQLLLARFGTGIGEAGTGPSINSIHRRPLHTQAARDGLVDLFGGLNVGLLLDSSAVA